MLNINLIKNKKHKNKKYIYTMVLPFFYITIFGISEWFVLYICGYYDDNWCWGSISENFVEQQHWKHFPQKYIIHKQGKHK